MTLENLFKIGNLHREPPDSKEFKGLVLSAQDRLEDAQNSSLSFASRFDLAYNAAVLPWRRYAPLVTEQISGIWSSNVWFILCRWRMLKCVFFLCVMSAGTWRNTKGIWTWMNSC